MSLRHVYHNEANWSVAMLGGAEVTAVVRRMPVCRASFAE